MIMVRELTPKQEAIMTFYRPTKVVVISRRLPKTNQSCRGTRRHREFCEPSILILYLALQ